LYYKAIVIALFLPGARRIIERGNCKSAMSDLSPDTQPPSQRARRATRPKTKASTPRRSPNPAASSSTSENLNELTPIQEDDSTLDNAIAEASSPMVDEPPPEPPSPPGDNPQPTRRGLAGTPLVSKPILLWGGIAGAGNFVFFLITLLVFNALGSTEADANKNSGVLNGFYCLSFLVPPALAFFAGFRATTREGGARVGAIAGLWSLIFLEALGLIYSFIALGVTNQLQTLDGTYWGSFAVNFLFEALIAFGAGYFGGWFSERRRRRAQQQELLTSS
jgi:hypothetical protein